MKAIYIRISNELHEEFKELVWIKKNSTFQAVLTEMIEDFIKKNKPA